MTSETTQETAIARRVTDAQTAAHAIVVRDDREMEQADHMAVGLAGLLKEINSTWEPHVKRALEQHRGLIAEQKRYAEPVEAARKTLKAKIAAYLDERARAIREREQRMEAELRLAAEREREAEAAAAVAAGEHDIAQAIRATPIEAPPVVLPSAPKTTTTIRRTWKFRVVDPAQVPAEYLTVDEGKIGRMVRAAQGQIAIPGVEIYSEAC